MDAIKLVSFKPKNKEIYNIMERLTQNPAIKINSPLAKQLGRYDKIRYIRKKNHIYIGKDHTKNTSIIMLDGVSIRKKGNRFFFDGL